MFKDSGKNKKESNGINTTGNDQHQAWNRSCYSTGPAAPGSAVTNCPKTNKQNYQHCRFTGSPTEEYTWGTPINTQNKGYTLAQCT